MRLEKNAPLLIRGVVCGIVVGLGGILGNSSSTGLDVLAGGGVGGLGGRGGVLIRVHVHNST